ncbi:hypothetical protein NPIL_468771 [Nephila pilipes]|uniref:Uncharacterized protein n=1 Tax=Nephila pilipes TaxID=299642 RepID=A0A8X6MZ89_NEPPI|nr:hypothetical protein NPIL_468771 [Nephila pilipes]
MFARVRIRGVAWQMSNVGWDRGRCICIGCGKLKEGRHISSNRTAWDRRDLNRRLRNRRARRQRYIAPPSMALKGWLIIRTRAECISHLAVAWRWCNAARCLTLTPMIFLDDA